MICEHCQYVFVPTKQPPDMGWRPFCPRCRGLYLERDPEWHVMRKPTPQEALDKFSSELQRLLALRGEIVIPKDFDVAY